MKGNHSFSIFYAPTLAQQLPDWHSN